MSHPVQRESSFAGESLCTEGVIQDIQESYPKQGESSCTGESFCAGESPCTEGVILCRRVNFCRDSHPVSRESFTLCSELSCAGELSCAVGHSVKENQPVQGDSLCLEIFNYTAGVTLCSDSS